MNWYFGKHIMDRNENVNVIDTYNNININLK